LLPEKKPTHGHISGYDPRSKQHKSGQPTTLTHPDCLINERRKNYLDCGDEQNYDYASAERNDTYAFFNPTVPAEPDNDTEQRTSTSARVKAAIDMFDNQLGTTQTKKRLLYVP
jgi:hypothetical protein